MRDVIFRAFQPCARIRCIHSPPTLSSLTSFRRKGTKEFGNNERSEHVTSLQWQILPTHLKAGDAEDKFFQLLVRKTKTRWVRPRWKGIKRPYTAEDVATKQGGHGLGPQVPTRPALKLFELLSRRFEAKEPVYTRETSIQVSVTVN